MQTTPTVVDSITIMKSKDPIKSNVEKSTCSVIDVVLLLLVKDVVFAAIEVAVQL